jgi:hypothetical protein
VPYHLTAWENQTALGRRFGLSAVAVGKKPKERGLRGAEAQPTPQATQQEFCHFMPLMDGTPFNLWQDREQRP